METEHRKPPRFVLVVVLAGLFAAYLLYEVLHAGHLEQTSLFYVGIPAAIAITVAVTARPKSATGVAMATITIGLALAGPLLGEGVVCLLMSAPLFYFIGLLVGGAIDYARWRDRQAVAIVAPLLLVAMLEGVTPATSLPRDEEVTAAATAARDVDIESALARPPVFGPITSPFLRLGFPRPLIAQGQGLAVGDTRTITFTPRRSFGIGAPLEPRALTLRVAERGPGRAVFRVEHDTTAARWMDLREAEFRWRGRRLEVTFRYRRTFDPSWYFGPLQRYAATQAAGYLAATFTS